MDYQGMDTLEWMKLAKNYNEFLLKLIESEITSDSITLDYGSGIGTFCLPLKEKGYDLCAFEIDNNQYKFLINNNMETYNLIDSLPNQHFDFIYSFNVLEHIEDDLDTLKNLKTKLKPDGILLLYLPAFNILFSSLDICVGHYRRYTKNSLRSKLISSGYKIEKLYYADCLGFFAALAFKLFYNKKGKTNNKSLIFFDKFIFPISLKLDLVFKTFFGKNIISIAHK